MQIKLIGNSNFAISLKNDGEKYFVVKKVAHEKDQHRLLKQCQKQQRFEKIIKNEPVLKHLFHVPQVYSVGKESIFSFHMEYIRGKTILDILEMGDITELYNILDKLALFIETEIHLSEWKTISRTIVYDKLNQIMSVCDPYWFDIGHKINEFVVRDLSLPIGVCHGDLTFANMIFNGKINLIDFLDGFIESPVQDIAKLKQEIELVWTWEMNHIRLHDPTKIRIGYAYLKKMLNQQLSEFGFDYEVNVLYLMTLFRIVPYLRNGTDTKKLLENALRSALQ